MSILGQQNINIGLPNEPTGSDSLYTAFTKTQQNFDTLFACASPYSTFSAGNGINVNAVANAGLVTITNTGVTNIIAGTNIVIDQSNGNVTISSVGGNSNGGGTVTSVGVQPVSTARLTTSNSPVVSSGNILIDLATTGVNPATYTNPTVTIDSYGRITSASNNIVSGTVTSVGLTPGYGIQINGGPVTSAGDITVTNTGVTRIIAGNGITASSSNGNVTLSASFLGGTVTSVGISSTQLVVSGSPVINDGVITVDLPENISLIGNVVANRIIANTGTINGNLTVAGNISPAAPNKVGGIKPGPGVDISLDGELTIDTANLPLSFGNFTADDNVLSIVSVDEDMILQTEGDAEIQLIGNIGFYKPDGIPPNIANRYFSATGDGQIKISVSNSDPSTAAVEIIGSTTGNIIVPGQTGAMLHITGQLSDPTRVYIDGNDDYVSLVARRWNGNVDTPTQVLANDYVLRINSTAATDAGVGNVAMAQIGFVALENQTTTAQGSKIEFSVTQIGNTAANRVEVANITVANGVTATKFTTAGTLSVAGNANVGNLGTSGQITATGNVNVGNLVIPTGNIFYTPRHGAFYSNVDQTNPIANTAMAMTFNNTTTANGVSVVSNSRLTIAKPGVYNIQFSAQVNKTGGGTSIADIWLNKDGNPVDWTNTSIYVTSGNPKVAAWNFVENVTVANTYFEIMWSSADTAVLLDAAAANTSPTRPGIPSVIVSVTPVGA